MPYGVELWRDSHPWPRAQQCLAPPVSNHRSRRHSLSNESLELTTRHSLDTGSNGSYLYSRAKMAVVSGNPKRRANQTSWAFRLGGKINDQTDLILMEYLVLRRESGCMCGAGFLKKHAFKLMQGEITICELVHWLKHRAT